MQAISRQPPGAEGLGQTRNKGSVSSDCPSAPPGQFGVGAAKADRPARTKGVRRILRPKQGGDDRLQGSAEFTSEPRAFGNSKGQDHFWWWLSSPHSPVHPWPLPPTSPPARTRDGPVQGASEEARREGERTLSSPPRQRDPPS